MGEYKGLAYTVARPIPKKHHLKSGNRIAAAADTLNWVVKSIGKQGLKLEIKRHIDHLHPQIKKATDAHNVVLVVVQYQQWKSKSGAGDNIQKILSVHIGAIARDRHLAYRIYEWKEEQPAFKLGPDKGMVYGQKEFLWFEDKKKQQEELKKDRGNQFWESAR